MVDFRGMGGEVMYYKDLLDKLGVEYDPSAKYLGRNGKFLGRPEPAIVNSCSQDTLYKIRG